MSSSREKQSTFMNGQAGKKAQAVNVEVSRAVQADQTKRQVYVQGEYAPGQVT